MMKIWICLLVLSFTFEGLLCHSEKHKCPRIPSLCPIESRPAGSLCFSRKEKIYFGEAKEICLQRTQVLLQLGSIPQFYQRENLNCLHLGDGPFYVDAIRISIGVWKSLNDPNGANLDFANFLLFNPNECWDGAVLAWYPYERNERRPYGTLKCHGTSKRTDAICITHPTLALLSGPTTREGNLWAYNPTNNIFGPVCDNGWDLNDAKVACHQLGFSDAQSFTTQSAYGNVASSFAYEVFTCAGTESTLHSCGHDDTPNCGQGEVAGAVCIRPASSSSSSSSEGH